MSRKEGLVEYEKIRDKLDTGDIVLFSGKGGISSGIKWFTISRWSHVGMVIKMADFDSIMLWESTTLKSVDDYDRGHPVRGVQLVSLSDRIKIYRGEIAIRLLDVKRNAAMRAALYGFRQEVKFRPYEQNKLELIKSCYDGPFGENEEDLSSLFCSELIAESYQRMGLIPNSIPSNEFTPKDFSEDSTAPLALTKGKLGPQILIQ